MSKLNKFLPDEVDLDNPKTWDMGSISKFYQAIHSHYGNFCGDCEHLSEDDLCEKGHRPRKHDLSIGPFEYLHVRKNCEDFELLKNTRVDEGYIRRNISKKLDWDAQQYG